MWFTSKLWRETLANRAFMADVARQARTLEALLLMYLENCENCETKPVR
jgi:hypothetical protein